MSLRLPVLLATITFGQGWPEATLAATAAAELDAVVVVGTRAQAADQPGSAHTPEADDLERARVLSVNEALRKVPGLVVRDEEGFGLRPNIGVRGLNPTRSTKVLLLEDGVPFTYAPYGDNASYFHPPIERYERVEILKGTGMLRFGPQTIGAVINYLTPAPPETLGGQVDLATGSLGYRRARLQVGGRGQVLDVVRKQGEGARDNQALDQTDAHYRWTTSLGDRHALTVRASALGEDSDVTYSGLTEAEYRNFGARYNPFVNDRFLIERYGGSASWRVALSDTATLATQLYYTEFHRDWGRQSSTTTDGQCGGAFTAARLAGERVDVQGCNSRQNRNRDYTTWGIEPRVVAAWSLGDVQSTLEAGLRLHRETQDRLQLNGTTPTATTGTVVEHNERDLEAWAGFVQNRFQWGRLALIPALRYERISMARVNRLGAGSRGQADVVEWIPGLGLTFDVHPEMTVFAGVHEGFAPPRVEDLIGAGGGSVDLDPESSRNVELGVRGRWREHLYFEVSAFDTDFDNQIAVGSIAGGSTPLAQGQARYRGAEVTVRAEFAPITERALLPFVEFAYTALPTAQQRSALVRVDTGQAVSGSAAGRRMPYAPRQAGTLRTGVETAHWDASIEAVFVGNQFADFANTDQAPVNGNGQIGRLGGYTTLHLTTNYTPPGSGWTLYATLKNALDRAFLADRTRGILPGAGRQVVVGASYAF